MSLLPSLQGFGQSRRREDKRAAARAERPRDSEQVRDPLSRILGTPASSAEPDLEVRDPLTGLLNPDSFARLVELQIEVARRAGRPLTLVCMRLDLFENGSLRRSHLAGIRLFREVSQRCVGCARDTDFVGRLDDDEFAVLLPGTDLEAGLTAAVRMKRRLEEPYVLDRGQAFVSVIFGIAPFPEGGADDAAELIRQAREGVMAARHVTAARSPAQLHDSIVYAAERPTLTAMERESPAREPVSLIDSIEDARLRMA